jgi:glycosyltransferase involved in cell wall biosynthesis
MRRDTGRPSRVSIAMATYNGTRYLPEQLDSFSRQTRAPHELVVYDDASTDETLAVLDEFALRSAFAVHIVRGEVNRGSAWAFEQAIARCSGDWIALSDQDDRWWPDKLATLDRCTLRHPGAGAFFSDGDVVNEDGRPLGYSLWDSVGFDRARQREFARHPMRVLLTQWVVTGAALMFRTAHRDLVLPLPDSSRHIHHPLVHDAWISAVIACVADVVPIAQPLIDYRIHSAQQKGVGHPSVLEERAAAGDAQRRILGEAAIIGNLPELETIAGRLDRSVATTLLNDVGRDVRSMLGHYRTRATLPARRWRRAGVVAKEAVSGRYWSYSNGARSIARDLWANAQRDDGSDKSPGDK